MKKSCLIFCLISHGAYLLLPYFGEHSQHSHTSRPLKHFLVNNSASILLFQGSIGLEVCEKCIYWKEDSICSSILKIKNSLEPKPSQVEPYLPYLKFGSKLVQMESTELQENNTSYSIYYEI